MNQITVTTKEELKNAKEKGYQEIIATGDLATDLKKASVIKALGPVAIGTLTAALALIPVTGGVSMVLAAPVWATVGITDTVVVTAIVTLGLTLVLAIFKEYDVEFEKTAEGMRAKLTRKENK